MRLAILWMACSLTACATPRPDIHFRIVNEPGKKRCGFSFKNDYTDDGRLKPDAKMTCVPTPDLKSLNKATLVEADGSETHFEDGLALLKAYIKNLREDYQSLRERCGP